jgi:serralysin
MANIIGTNGDDVLSGTPQSDNVNLRAGNDVFFAGAGNDVVLGGLGADAVRGDSGRDRLNGDFGNDFLVGGSDNDRLDGGVGLDRLDGGSGVDTLTGGFEGDIFDYNSVLDSGVGVGARDVITDLAPGSDRIDLSTIDARAGLAGNQSFSLIGTSAFSGEGQVRTFVSSVTDNLVVEVNTSGSSGAEFQIEVAGLQSLSLNDFLL